MLEQIGMGAVAGHEAALTRYALMKLKEVPGVAIYGETEPSYTTNRSSVIPFTVRDIPPHLVAAILGFEYGIGVRSGCFCAQPYVMSLLKINRQGQHRIRYDLLHKRRDLVPGMVRVSFGLYNTREEIDALIEALTAISQGTHGEYTVDRATGFYTPANNNAENFSAHFEI
jgi:selenocysteine lyase/cysteine desulfurase